MSLHDTEIAVLSKHIDNVPHPRSSDHLPISLQLHQGRKQRWQSERGAPKLPYIPEWLLDHGVFRDEFRQFLESWKDCRAPGLQGLELFNRLLANSAKAFLQHQLLEARSASHKFDVAVSLLAFIQSGLVRIPMSRVERALSIYPGLGNLITIVQRCSNRREAELREHVQDLMSDVLVEKDKKMRTEMCIARSSRRMDHSRALKVEIL